MKREIRFDNAAARFLLLLEAYYNKPDQRFGWLRKATMQKNANMKNAAASMKDAKLIQCMQLEVQISNITRVWLLAIG